MKPPPPFNFAEGEVVLIDKPLRWTSFDVVNKLRRLMGTKKVGHAGTLDPLATGLLILCTGKNTKKIEQYQAQEKEYTGTIRLGQTTPSLDAETEVSQTAPAEHIDQTLIEQTATRFIGEQEQFPPAFSAIKINGKPAYELARKGREVELKARTISIHELEFTSYTPPDLHFRMVCSKGTYVRSFARDFAEAMGTVGYLTALRRTRIGTFTVENAWALEALVAELTPETPPAPTTA